MSLTNEASTLTKLFIHVTYTQLAFSTIRLIMIRASPPQGRRLSRHSPTLVDKRRSPVARALRSMLAL